MKKALLLVLCMISLHTGWSQEAEIRARIDKMFQAMSKADTSVLSKYFTPGAVFFTYSYDYSGNPKSKGEVLSDFLRRVDLNGPSDMDERLTQWQCLIDDGIASVWAPYEFYFEGKFNHCGVNSFQLINVQGEWKITMISDTRRKKPCPNADRQVAVIDSLIEGWHYAAAIADENAFFGRMAPEAIYIGTDATERWTRDELKEWSRKYFEKESAWNFRPLSRNIKIGPGGQIAWFDELLDTPMGTCRSTGIMEKKDGDWKIFHYQLSLAVPNEKIDDFKLLIGKT